MTTVTEIDMSKPKKFKSRNWCFTINASKENNDYPETNPFISSGYTYYPFEYEDIPENWDKEYIKYLCYQFEQQDNLHIQGYIVLTTAVQMTTMKNRYGDKIHWEIRRAETHKEAIEYCEKDDETTIPNTFVEWGERPTENLGHRSDVDRLKEAKDLIKGGMTKVDLLDQFPDVFIKYSTGIEKMMDFYRDKKKETDLQKKWASKKLRRWQEIAEAKLEIQTERQILWIWDEDGNTGKTTLAKYLSATKDCFLCCNGKISDIALAYKGEPYIAIDFTRQYEGMVNYSVLESFKNEYIFSPKYNSSIKRFNCPKVVVFANFPPEINSKTISKDRLDETTFKTSELTGPLDDFIQTNRNIPDLPISSIIDELIE